MAYERKTSLTQLNAEEYRELRVEDSAGEAYFRIPMETPIYPDWQKRTIFIGLGGSGIRLLEQLKKTVVGRMIPGWERYVAFLGVDTDCSELEACKYLTREERLFVSYESFGSDVWQGPDVWPPSWRMIADPEDTKDLTNPGDMGSGLMVSVPGC